MSIHGFVDQNGQIQKYDYNDLENIPDTIGEEIVLVQDVQPIEENNKIWLPLTQSSNTVEVPTMDEFNALAEEVQSGGLSEAAKEALLALLQHVAYVDEHGQDYYDDLEEALAGGTQYTITNNLTGCITSNSSTKIIEGRTYTATITASSGYTLTGATATATMGGQTVTGFYNNGTISIPNVTGNLVITVTASSSVASISAVFTQGQNVVYTNDSLDSLRQYLVVTATYSDSTTDVVTDYTLSGTLGEGTRTITVSYGGKTDTFTVACTVNGWLYHFNQSIISSGSHDFGLTGVENYTNGVNTGDKCYYHHVATEGDSSTDPLGLYALSSEDYPNWAANDFTIAMWFKSDTADRGHMFAAAKRAGTSNKSWIAPANIASGWSVANSTANQQYAGIRLGHVDGKLYLSIMNTSLGNGATYRITAPSGFDSTQWHHYALTRSGAVLYYFVDGNLIFTITLAATSSLYTCNSITIGNFNTESSTTPAVVPALYSTYHQDLYVTIGHAKWTSNFDPSAIVY